MNKKDKQLIKEVNILVKRLDKVIERREQAEMACRVLKDEITKIADNNEFVKAEIKVLIGETQKSILEAEMIFGTPDNIYQHYNDESFNYEDAAKGGVR